MTIKARMLYFVMGCLVVWSLGSSAQTAPADLKNGFEQPPDTAKPWVLWMWLGGNISREGITADLEAMKRVGIGGAQIFNLGCLSSDPVTVDPVNFMTLQWRDMLHFALAEAV